jgi:hypothetical protein
MAFLAYLAAIGLRTMKGMVESAEDPLLYSDDKLIQGFAQFRGRGRAIMPARTS